MADSTENQTTNLVELAGDPVSAYVSHNSVAASELSGLIQSVHAALERLKIGGSEIDPEEAPEKPTPAQVRKSVAPDGIVSFLDGKTYKTLKRHLTGHGLDPQSYRQRYGLPPDYPMVSPDYAARRSALAKSIGLGRVADRSKAQPKAKRRG